MSNEQFPCFGLRWLFVWLRFLFCFASFYFLFVCIISPVTKTFRESDILSRFLPTRPLGLCSEHGLQLGTFWYHKRQAKRHLGDRAWNHKGCHSLTLALIQGDFGQNIQSHYSSAFFYICQWCSLSYWVVRESNKIMNIKVLWKMFTHKITEF